MNVGVAAAAGGVGVGPLAVGDGLELPQAASVAAKTTAVAASRRALISVTCEASVAEITDTRGPTGRL